FQEDLLCRTHFQNTHNAFGNAPDLDALMRSEIRAIGEFCEMGARFVFLPPTGRVRAREASPCCHAHNPSSPFREGMENGKTVLARREKPLRRLIFSSMVRGKFWVLSDQFFGLAHHPKSPAAPTAGVFIYAPCLAKYSFSASSMIGARPASRRCSFKASHRSTSSAGRSRWT